MNKKKTLNKSVHCRYLAGLCAVSDSTFYPCPMNDDPLTISRMLLKIGAMHWIIWALKILLRIKVGLYIIQTLCGDVLYIPVLDFKHDTDMEGRIKVGTNMG